MSYLALCFAALTVLYLLECIAWVPSDAFVFKVTDMGARVAVPILVFHGIKKNLVLGPLLPGTSGIAVCQAEAMCGAKGTTSRDYAKLLDAHKVARIWASYRKHTNLLVFETQIQIILVFIFMPWVGFRITPYALIYLFPIWLLLQIHITYLFVSLTKRKLFRPKERGSEIATLILSPALALRTNDLILRDLFEQFHWLAVARVTCRVEYALELTKAYIRNLEFPTPSEKKDRDSTSEAAVIWKRSVWDFVFKEYGEIDILPPSPGSADAECYCPRCFSQFIAAAELCTECEIPLISFSEWDKAAPICRRQ